MARTLNKAEQSTLDRMVGRTSLEAILMGLEHAYVLHINNAMGRDDVESLKIDKGRVYSMLREIVASGGNPNG